MKLFRITCLLMLSFLFIQLEAAVPKKTVCLNMIIKNESHVMERCLSSLMHFIDYWVIVDTGSTDGTQDLVRHLLSDIPGELHERPWVNFAHNRNEALDLACGKADYILFIDADEVLRFDPNFILPSLTKDFYFFKTEYGSTSYLRVGLVKDGLNWRWEGVVHEAINSSEARSSDVLKGIVNIPTPDGASWQDPEKYLKHAKMLEEDLKKNPNNTRSQFYLAMSYKDYGDKEKAIYHFHKRVKMGGWAEEVYWSLLQIALLQEDLGKPDDVVIKGYFAAANYRPSRVEADYYLASFYRRLGDYSFAQFLLEKAMHKPPSGDYLFNQDWITDWGLLFEYSICAYWTGQYQESIKACDKIIANPRVPENYKRQTILNRQFALDRIQQANYYHELHKYMLKFA